MILFFGKDTKIYKLLLQTEVIPEIMASWRCMNDCGACCYLDPAERPELGEYLTSEELELYVSLVDSQGWCIHFDHHTRQCRIYQQRPQFCRVTPDNFERMYDVTPADFADFAIACCHQQIKATYGRKSKEMRRYQREVG